MDRAGPLAWRQIRGAPAVAPAIAQQLNEAFRLQLLQTGVYERELQRAVSCLRRAAIEPIVFKGWAAAQTYPERGARPLGDLDLVIHPAQLEAAQEVLEDSGRFEILIDLVHMEIDLLDQRRFDDLLARSCLLRLGDIEVRVLGPEDQLRALCIHLLKHGAYRPLWLCDIAAALEHRPARFDWERCLGSDPKRGRWVGSALRLAHELLGASLQDTPSAVRGVSTPRWLASEVLRLWSDPSPKKRQTPELFAHVWSRPSLLPAALRARWWDPIRSTLHLRGDLGGCPRVAAQLASFLARGSQYLSRTLDRRA